MDRSLLGPVSVPSDPLPVGAGSASVLSDRVPVSGNLVAHGDAGRLLSTFEGLTRY
jgi:hypothetical protein